MTSLYWINKTMSTMFLSGTHQFYIGLSSSIPQLDGSNVTEPDGDGYARMPLDCLVGPVDGVVYNQAAIAFPQALSEWFSSSNRARCWVVFDGVDADAQVVCTGLLTIPIAIRAGSSISIPAGQVRIAMMNPRSNQ